jgi:hypothetical protein
MISRIFGAGFGAHRGMAPICEAQITMQASKHQIPKTPATEGMKTFKK